MLRMTLAEARLRVQVGFVLDWNAGMACRCREGGVSYSEFGTCNAADPTDTSTTTVTVADYRGQLTVKRCNALLMHCYLHLSNELFVGFTESHRLHCPS